MTMEFSTKAFKKLSSKELENAPTVAVFKTEAEQTIDENLKRIREQGIQKEYEKEEV